MMIVDCSAYGPGSGVPRRDSDAHTPGPWAIYASSVADQAERSWMKGVTIYSAPTGKRIADTCWLNSSNDHNARLIVAAPDLLAACKEFVRKVDAGEARSTRSYAQMKAAIAKAEGVNPEPPDEACPVCGVVLTDGDTIPCDDAARPNCPLGQ